MASRFYRGGGCPPSDSAVRWARWALEQWLGLGSGQTRRGSWRRRERSQGRRGTVGREGGGLGFARCRRTVVGGGGWLDLEEPGRRFSPAPAGQDADDPAHRLRPR